MNLKNKILIILGLCFILSVSSYFIIKKMFDNFENLLLEKCRIEALTGARMMSELMEFMVNQKVLTEADIMDTAYREIPGSNPKKFTTRYDKIFDSLIQKIEDEFLRDPDIDFAVLADRNGYVPTHNSKYSRAQTGDYAKDLVQSRSKRNFSSNPAIKKVIEYTGPDTIRELYHRDTGETMWDIGAPVNFRGKHWGAFVLGVSLKRVNELKNQMVIMIVMIMFVILSLTMLAVFAVIPRTILTSDLDGEQSHF
ncbi:MAG TPA: hypothetical protein PKM65_05090 [Spirochaetota bacterium]|nr:hypothetical protein [Spirochaetota bacterium]HNT10273.1 hypothetical protein [Spirochaetota bacterium]HNV47907.1 hypothetical protein [Spirochaetota bacterium]HPU89930.1 hypothetical protein [Spirochaetota bacterium]